MMLWAYLLFCWLVGAGAAWMLRVLPARWLCDYGEQPGSQHEPACRKLSPWKLALFGLANAACVCALVLRRGEMAQWRYALLFLLGALLCGTLLLAALCDAKYGILPDELLGVAAALGLALWAAGGLAELLRHWYSPFLGAALGFFGLWAVEGLAARLYHAEALGFGDVKLMGVLGLVCGPVGLGAALLAAVLSAAVVFCILLALRRAHRKDLFPFGPFLVGGALSVLGFWPLWQLLFGWYIRLF